MTTHVAFGRPPKALRKARLENVALVPGNMLPYKDQYQAIANSLPKGEVLIVVPPTDQPGRLVLERVASLLRSDGHQVTTIRSERLI